MEFKGGKGKTFAGKGLVYSSPVHCNGDLLCAIDTETTGTDYERHDIVDICILPLNSDYSLNKNVNPFNLKIKPRRPENIDDEALRVNKISRIDLALRGVDSDTAADYLRKWLAKINLPQGKQIIPVAQNYPFDRGFLQSWLGQKEYESIFSYGFRDTLAVSLFINDVFDFRAEKIPYSKNSLRYLCSTLRIVNPAPHTALGDCVTTAACYKRFLEQVAYGGFLQGAKRDSDLETSIPNLRELTPALPIVDEASLVTGEVLLDASVAELKFNVSPKNLVQ